jgi:Ca2+-binding EF-hand superfamily protein
MKSFPIIALSLIVAVSGAHAQDAATKAYIDGGFAAMDANHDGKVDRAEFGRFMTARLRRQAVAFNAAFAGADKDRDGKLDRREAAANPALTQHFAAIDTNKDGRLSKEEVRAALIAAQATEVGA